MKSGRDVALLKKAGLQAMANKYTGLPIGKASIDKLMDQGNDPG
jgi:hypothetical protein